MKNNDDVPDTTIEPDQQNSGSVLIRDLEIFQENYFHNEFDMPNFADSAYLDLDISNLTPPSNGIPSSGMREPQTVDTQTQSALVSTVQSRTGSSEVDDPHSKCYLNLGNGWILGSPIFVLRIEDVPGIYNLSLTITHPPISRQSSKWMYNEALKKLYVKKDTYFPVTVDLDCSLNDADIFICPVFTELEKRLYTVRRCPVCQMRDSDTLLSEHIIQVNGVEASYIEEGGRLITRIPVSDSEGGRLHLDFLVKIGCLTTCVGGPNRRPFGILFTLVRGNREFGRRFIEVKCCTNPQRSFRTDAPRSIDCASSLELAPVGNFSKKTKKRKREMEATKCSEKTAYLEVPVKFMAAMKEFLQLLVGEEESKKRKHECDSE